MSSIGEYFKSLRLDLGLTLEELAAKTSFSVSFLSEVESGIYIPSKLKLKHFSQIMDVDEIELTLLRKMSIMERNAGLD